jgi:DNA polymerase phi
MIVKVHRLRNGNSALLTVYTVLGAEREATHFKIRILDLLDLYAKKQPRNSQILRFILPLIQISRTTSGGSEEQLATKATSVLQRIAKSKEAVKIEGDGQDTAKEILKEIHDLARKAPNGAFLSTLSLCSLFVTRALLLADPSASPFIVEQYIASLEDFITRKNSGLHMNFFLEFIRRQPVTAWGLRENLVSLCGSSKSVNVYRQLQAFNLLQASIEHGARNVSIDRIFPRILPG